MNWTDPVGRHILAVLVNRGAEARPDIPTAVLTQGVERMSTSVGLTRQAIANAIYAELDIATFYKEWSEVNISQDFLAGILFAAQLVEQGTTLTQ